MSISTLEQELNAIRKELQNLQMMHDVVDTVVGSL